MTKKKKLYNIPRFKKGMQKQTHREHIDIESDELAESEKAWWKHAN